MATARRGPVAWESPSREQMDEIFEVARKHAEDRLEMLQPGSLWSLRTDELARTVQAHCRGAFVAAHGRGRLGRT